MENFPQKKFEGKLNTRDFNNNPSSPKEIINLDAKLNEQFPKSFLDKHIGNTCTYLNNLEKKYPVIESLGLKKAVVTAIIASQFISPTPSFAKNPDYANNTYFKQNTTISSNQFIPKDFPNHSENTNILEQKYDGPSVKINNIPSGVNWVMPDNMSSSSNPDYNIYSEDCGWITLDNNSRNINPSISFNNFSINFGTADSNQSYIYRVGIKVYDKFGNLIAQIYGESPICNKDNYNSFNVGFSTNHFSTGYSQYGSDGEQYVDENTKNTIYLHTAKQLAFEAALRNLPALKPLTPPANSYQVNNTNQYPSQQYSTQYSTQYSNYTPNNTSTVENQTISARKININNGFDPYLNNTDILYTDYAGWTEIILLDKNGKAQETIKKSFQATPQAPFNIMEIVNQEFKEELEKTSSCNFKIKFYLTNSTNPYSSNYVSIKKTK